MIENIIQFFKKTKKETEAPIGVCPICWGEQAYDNKIREMYKDKQIDVSNHHANHSFIQQFVVNQIDGITLKKGVCPTCNRIQ